MMKEILYLSTIVALLTSACVADLFDLPTGQEMKADARAQEIISVPSMQLKAESGIEAYIAKPENLMVIEHNTRSFEKMGTSELASHVQMTELIEQELKNPVIMADFGEKDLFLRGVSGKIMVNNAMFEQSDVNTFFTNEEMVKIEKVLQEKAYQSYLASPSFDGMFFGYSY